jgi:hypothetical protein
LVHLDKPSNQKWTIDADMPSFQNASRTFVQTSQLGVSLFSFLSDKKEDGIFIDVVVTPDAQQKVLFNM